jgi:hypothetical protein
MPVTQAAAKLVTLAVACAAAVGGFAFWQYTTDEQGRLIEDQAREIEYLRNVASRLTLETRVARLIVVGRETDEAGRIVREVEFIEIDPDGEPMPGRRFRLVGDRVHVDAKVIKFADEYVAEGDELRGRSLYVWDRIYGSATEPENGLMLDPVDAAPSAYVGEDLSAIGLDEGRRDFEAELWADFMRLARDSDYAAEQGVRVAQGEGVNGDLEMGFIYELTIESDGGLSLYSRAMDPTIRALLERLSGTSPTQP